VEEGSRHGPGLHEVVRLDLGVIRGSAVSSISTCGSAALYLPSADVASRGTSLSLSTILFLLITQHHISIYKIYDLRQNTPAFLHATFRFVDETNYGQGSASERTQETKPAWAG
jgi:hypothetical protein